MGCCGSKADTDERIEKVAEAAAFGGTVAAGAAIGGAVSGPAAPIGMAVGALVGAIIAKSTAGTVGKVITTPVGLLRDV